MDNTNYAQPVSALLALGDPGRPRAANDRSKYRKLGIRASHIPDLLRMAADDELNRADEDSPLVWAPVHAWRALGELRAAEAIEPLITLLDIDDEIVAEELPEVFARIGPPAIEPLTRYLGQRERLLYGRIAAASSLAGIASQHPGARDACVAALVAELDTTRQHPTIAGFVIGALVDLKAHEAMPSIKAAFDAGRVDPTVTGNLLDVQIHMKFGRGLGPIASEIRGLANAAVTGEPLTRAQRRAVERARRKASRLAARNTGRG